MWPHRWQPTRLPHPWDSPGKNTGVGCHFLLQCMKVKSESEVTQSCLTFRDSMDCSLPGSSIHGIFQARVLEWARQMQIEVILQNNWPGFLQCKFHERIFFKGWGTPLGWRRLKRHDNQIQWLLPFHILSWEGKFSYDEYYWDKWRNLNVGCILLDNSTMSVVKFYKYDHYTAVMKESAFVIRRDMPKYLGWRIITQQITL